MNNRIRDYIDGMFTGVTLEGEAAELHDELCANCSERFEDLLSQGYSEEEAFAFVREGMGDMEELIAPYRRRSRAAQEAPRSEEGAEPYFEQAFDVTDVTTLEVDSKESTISVIPNSGGELVVMYEQEGDGVGFAPPVITRMGDTLRVEVPRRDSFSFTMNLESTLQSIANLLRGKGLRGARLTLAVPQGMMPQLNVRGASGSMRLEGVALRGADVRLASGSIRVEADARVRGGVYELHTASGSIRCSAAADEMGLYSMSGSVKANCDARRLTAQAVSGSVRVEGPIQEIEAKSTSGSVHALLAGADVRSVKAHSVSGSVHIALPEQIRGFTLSAHSLSGRVHNAFESDRWGDQALVIEAASTSGSVHIEKL